MCHTKFSIIAPPSFQYVFSLINSKSQADFLVGALSYHERMSGLVMRPLDDLLTACGMRNVKRVLVVYTVRMRVTIVFQQVPQVQHEE